MDTYFRYHNMIWIHIIYGIWTTKNLSATRRKWKPIQNYTSFVWKPIHFPNADKMECRVDLCVFPILVKNKLSFQISIFLQVRNHNISQIWWRITEPNLLVQYYLQNYGVKRHGDEIRLVNIIIPLGSKKISWSIGIYIDIFNWNTHTCIYIDMITTNSSKNHVKENMKNLSQKRILSQTPRWERERRFWNSPYLLYFSK